MRHSGQRFALNKQMYRDNSPAFVVARATAPYYSLDGITWHQGTGTPSAQVYSGAYGNGVWVFAGTGNNYFVSTNGIDFSVVTGAGGVCGNNGRNRLVFSKSLNKFVAIRGTNASMNAYTSSDGINWVLSSAIPSGYVDSNLFCTDSSLLMECYNATGAYDVRILQSTDAVTWNERYSITVGSTSGSPSIGYVTDSEAGFLNPSMANTSRSIDNGVSWNNQVYSFGTKGIEANTNLMGYSKTLDRLVGFRCTNTERVIYSDDGINWITASGSVHSTSGNTASRLAWSDKANKFMLITSGIAGISYSNDGITWTAITSDPFGFNPSALIAR